MTTRKMVFTALFAALGIIIPQIFHLFGGPTLGFTLLPIHLPVFIGAMLLGPISGMIIAVVSLTVGVLLGMPPFLIAVFMMVEMVTYGFVTGYLYYTKKWNIFLSLTLGKTSGMLMSLLAINIALLLFDLALPPTFGTIAMFSLGIPGIIIQFILVPIIVIRLKGVRYLYE